MRRIRSIINGPKSTIAAVLHDKSGNYAVIFALALMPIVLSAGLAVDYTSAYRTKATIQDALDAAALAAGTSDDIPDAERIAIANLHFEQAMEEHAIGASVQFTITGNMTCSPEMSSILG